MKPNAGFRGARGHPPGSPPASPRRRSGVTLVEVVLALAILAVGAGMAMRVMIGVSSLLRASNERAQALEAVENVLETLRGETFEEVFARFNATAADDPPLGDSPGNAFPAGSLEARPGDPDGLPGEILFPGGGLTLLENVVDAEMGMPRDLNGDGAVDALDHAPDYGVLPVRIRVRWRGASGDRDLEIAATLTNIRNIP